MLLSIFYIGLTYVMDDRSWMYRDSPEWLRRMDYYNGVQGFINYILFNPRNISGCNIRCPYKRCKNKKFIDPNIVTMNLLQKRFMERYLCQFVHGEPYVPHETMVEKIVGLTSSFSNVHEVVDDNSNPYQNMIMDMMRMNQGYIGQCPILDEELNANAAKIFDLLKDSDEPLWDRCTNHGKLSVIAHVFTIKSDHELSEAGYNRILEWAKAFYLKGIG